MIYHVRMTKRSNTRALHRNLNPFGIDVWSQVFMEPSVIVLVAINIYLVVTLLLNIATFNDILWVYFFQGVMFATINTISVFGYQGSNYRIPTPFADEDYAKEGSQTAAKLFSFTRLIITDLFLFLLSFSILNIISLESINTTLVGTTVIMFSIYLISKLAFGRIQFKYNNPERILNQNKEYSYVMIFTFLVALVTQLVLYSNNFSLLTPTYVGLLLVSIKGLCDVYLNVKEVAESLISQREFKKF